MSTGSRSAPLAYAVADASARGELTLHVRIDERDAAFLALGIARGRALDAPADSREPRVTPAPVAVVTTSGTAVANLHPAVLEADHAGVPLLLVTAVWGSTFFVIKDAVGRVDPVDFLVVRFAIGAAIPSVLFLGRLRRLGGRRTVGGHRGSAQGVDGCA